MNYKIRQLFLFIHIIIFSVVFYIFYPPFYAIEDENNYLGMAYVLKSGHIFPDEVGAKFVSLYSYKGHLVSKYPIGNSLFLIPFTLIGWNGVFLFNFILHVIGFIIFIKILIRFNLPLVYSLLFLYYPPFTLYMRTIMSDLPTAFFTISGFYTFLLGGKWLFFSGFLIGLSCFVRYTNVIVCGMFCAALAYPLLKRIISERNYRKEEAIEINGLIKFIFGFSPFALIILYYNYYTLGSPFLTVYGLLDPNDYAFSIKHMPGNFVFYLKALLVIYPFLLIAMFIYNGKERLLCHLLFWSVLIFYSLYFYTPDFGTGIQKIVVGMRFLLPVLFVGIIAYAFFIEKIRKKSRVLGVVLLILINLLVLPYFIISYKHYDYLKNWAMFKEFFYSNTGANSFIVCDGEVPKIILDVWGRRNYEQYVFVDKKLQVENKIDNAISKGVDVYLSLIIRPFKDNRNIYSAKYRDEILNEYVHEKVGEKQTPAGRIEIYKLLKHKL